MKPIHVSGRRKRAISRATLTQGKGDVRINGKALDIYFSEVYALKVKEPLILADEVAGKVDISVNVFGGGVNAQAEAARLAIARALVECSKDKSLKERFAEYDRHLLVADTRYKEARKPNRSKARAKRQTSYR
ncbi:MAG TPA: 30S ribosomal protein S9 [Candidatus Woesearchaeota archaeon]|nr:30S ribosomal protein S9 [Candidatus Woesearchaeota archaeon]